MWVSLYWTPGSTKCRQNDLSKASYRPEKNTTQPSLNHRSRRVMLWVAWISPGSECPSQFFKGQTRECCGSGRDISKALRSPGKPETLESPGTATLFFVI